MREILLTGGVEPMLRATCTHEIDATQALEAVVERPAAIGSRRDQGKFPMS